MRHDSGFQKRAIALAVFATLGWSASAIAADDNYTAIENINIIANTDSSATEGVHILSNGVAGGDLNLTSADTAAAAEIHVVSDGTIASYSDGDTVVNVDTDNGGYGSFTVNDFNGGSPTVQTIYSDAQNTTLTTESSRLNLGTGEFYVDVGATGLDKELTITDSTVTIGNANLVVNGTTDLNNNLTVDIGNDGGNELIVSSGAVDLNGTTTINTGASDGNTTIGNTSNTVAIYGSSVGINNTSAQTTNIGFAGGTNNINGTTNNITGATNINTSGAATTSIGTAGGATSIGSASSTNTILGTTGITGATTINTSGALSTTIGNSSSAVNISGGTNTIGNAGSSANIITGATNTNTATTSNAMSGANANVNLSNNSATLGVTSGSTITATNAAASVLASDGSGLNISNTGSISLLNELGGTDAGLTISANGDDITLLNDVGGGHGLEITGISTTLSGGTNSSSLTLLDASATLAVGTATSSETGAILVTGVDADGAGAGTLTNTAVTIGGANNISNALTSTTTNTLTAGTNNVLGATQQNQLTGGTGNSITATTGNNAVTALAGSNTVSANADNQSNTLSATGANGVNYITANGATGTNNIEARTNNIGLTTASSINTIGNATTSVNTLQGLSNAITGTTSINVGTGGTVNNYATNINTGTNTQAVTMGNSANITNLNSATNNIGVSSSYATFNNIGTDSTFVSTNRIGNTNLGTTVNSYGGVGYQFINDTNSTMGTGTGGMVQTSATSSTVRASSSGALASNGTTGTMTLGAGGGYTTYATSQNTGFGTTIGGVVDNKDYTNKINGNLFVDGNVYINGTLDYVSSNSANTTVVGGDLGTSNLAGATQGTVGGYAIVMKGSPGLQTVVDDNGRLTNVNGVAAESTAALTLTNGLGETHGLVITESQTTISGGTSSSSMTLGDNGATFSNSATGRPVQVHGVADGTADYDAVNVRQLRSLKRGLAATTAMANIPQVDTGKTFSVGMGVGGYDDQEALAIGASARIAENAVVRASVGHSFSSGKTSDNTTWGVGAAFSW